MNVNNNVSSGGGICCVLRLRCVGLATGFQFGELGFAKFR